MSTLRNLRQETRHGAFHQPLGGQVTSEIHAESAADPSPNGGRAPTSYGVHRVPAGRARSAAAGAAQSPARCLGLRRSLFGVPRFSLEPVAVVHLQDQSLDIVVTEDIASVAEVAGYFHLSLF